MNLSDLQLIRFQYTKFLTPSKAPAEFLFASGVEMLRWVEQKYGLAEFAIEEETTFFGWINQTDAVHLWVELLWADGSTQPGSEGRPFVFSEIQLISFDTDYFNSM